jgi:tetratricopeptide (TPR) repeat protein
LTSAGPTTPTRCSPPWWPTAAQNHLGYALYALDRQEEGLEAFEAFAAGWPGNPSAHDSLADGFMALGRIEEAIAHLARALLLERRFAYAWMHLGDVMRATNDPALAEQAYRRAQSVGQKLYGPRFQDVVQARLDELQR